MNIEKYPAEIFLHIFSRLPWKSLCIIRCVCKQWDKLSGDPCLHSMRLARARAIERQTSFLITRTDMNAFNETNCVELFTQHFTSRHNLFSFSGWGRILHSCDALLCTVKHPAHSSQVIVSNPFTREHLTLPQPRLPTRLQLSLGSFGLGFDSSIGKYKVVCVFYRDNKRCHLDAQVYTIGTSTSWRHITSQPTVPICVYKKSVYASGARHWMVSYYRVMERSNDLAAMVVSFDFAKEEFKTIPCQEFFSVSKSSDFSLVDLRGCLGMVHFSWARHIQIWKLKDCERNVWVREYKIGMDVWERVEMVGLMGEDDIVFSRITYCEYAEDDDDRPDDALLAYNVETTTWRKLYSFTDVPHGGIPDRVYLLHGRVASVSLS